MALLGSLACAACSEDPDTGTTRDPSSGDEDEDEDEDNDNDGDEDNEDNDEDTGAPSAMRDGGGSAGGIRDSGAGGRADAGGGGGTDAGASLDTGARSDAGAKPDSGPGPSAGGNKPPCLKSPSQIVALGDSYVALPVVLIPRIQDLAIADGALSAGQAYRDYSAPGTTTGSPSAPGSIPPQLDQALAEDDDIIAVIMDGGGNDIIGSVVCLADGSHMDPACVEIVQGAMDVTAEMAMKAKAAGVQDVVYFLYPHVPLGGNDILDYSVEQATQLVADLTTEDFRVHLVDTRAAFEGHAEYFGLDPIHPNDAGGQVIAELVWKKMKDECIAQPESSGCCEP